MPDFNNMTAAELSEWYFDVVGYDPLEEDPEMSLDEFRTTCVEFYEQKITDEQHPQYSSVA